MEDENGLELSLGLSLGGSSGKSMARDIPLEPNINCQMEESSSSKGSVLASDANVVHYLQTNAENQELGGKQRHNPVTLPFGNFWQDQGGSSAPVVDGSNDPMSYRSQFPRYQDGWISNNKGNISEDQKPILSKRKVLSEEICVLKKHSRVAEALSKSSDGGAKNTPISISTNDGSTGENEDVGESEAEGSNSWLVSQREDSAKGSAVNKGSDRKGFSNAAAFGFQGQKKASFLGSELSSGKVAHGTPLSFQVSNTVTVPYNAPGQASAAHSITNAASLPPAFKVQLRPTSSNGLVTQAISGANSQVPFGCPTVHPPILETSSSWTFGAPPHILHSFAAKDKGEGAENHHHAEDDVKKPQGTGASSSGHLEDETKVDKGFSLMGSAIRPGIVSDVKFGGSGSYPNLPWVSATGAGPNGRAISGVSYKIGRNEVKIVCACHGTHMSSEEFVRHASADAPSQEISTSLPAFPVGNQAASAQN